MFDARNERQRNYFINKYADYGEDFTLTDDELAFFKGNTGIHDVDELKKHIKAIRNEAFEIHPYPCIFGYAFVRLKVSRLPAYKELLRLGRERPGALYLDLGTCFGSDIRKPVFDGFPVGQAVGADLRKEFWNLGYKLFKDSPEIFPVPFVQGDVFDSNFLPELPILSEKPTEAAPALSTLTSLAPLHGRLSAIFTAAFFHLFSESKQEELARKLAALLSPEPGSIIFGQHVGSTEKGILVDEESMEPMSLFCHSPESWQEMWQGVFPNGKVKVDAFLKTVSSPGQKPFYVLAWSVTRL